MITCKTFLKYMKSKCYNVCECFLKISVHSTGTIMCIAILRVCIFTRTGRTSMLLAEALACAGLYSSATGKSAHRPCGPLCPFTVNCTTNQGNSVQATLAGVVLIWRKVEIYVYTTYLQNVIIASPT